MTFAKWGLMLDYQVARGFVEELLIGSTMNREQMSGGKPLISRLSQPALPSINVTLTGKHRLLSYIVLQGTLKTGFVALPA
ncbi:hypothetical protein Mfla_1152 [Methylobacillus flagellatus KT]|uniref:Uncharacterized protein n=1 Tax=Methylobacillus flagellatus (strain ATCC 51484 / DSM 6875 / VKM B-1610 / KT) TaxID=265072 RepID=Q1H267_METFK|nr:hypothetical protein Mfla_1152 [Methylobacillus flagellatus KT]